MALAAGNGLIKGACAIGQKGNLKKKRERLQLIASKKGVWISWFLGGKVLIPYLSQQLGQL